MVKMAHGTNCNHSWGGTFFSSQASLALVPLPPMRLWSEILLSERECALSHVFPLIKSRNCCLDRLKCTTDRHLVRLQWQRKQILLLFAVHLPNLWYKSTFELPRLHPCPLLFFSLLSVRYFVGSTHPRKPLPYPITNSARLLSTASHCQSP